MGEQVAPFKIKKAEFIKSATRPAHFPDSDVPEVAFAGRSNVGKSSIINAMTGRRSLVKVSGTPGRTQLVNFFTINDELTIVDLPGYGFARVPASVKATWGRMIEGYLGGRPQLKAVVVLLDLRRGIQEDDTQLIEALPHFGIQPILVFTKADKFKRNKRMERRREIAREHGLVAGEMILTSATKRFGIEELWLRIKDMTGANL